MRHLVAVFCAFQIACISAADTAALKCDPLMRGDAEHRALPFDRGLLFEVSSPGVSRSFVFGTMHISDERVTRLPPVVAGAFDESRRFVMEAVFDADAIAELRSLDHPAWHRA